MKVSKHTSPGDGIRTVLAKVLLVCSVHGFGHAGQAPRIDDRGKDRPIILEQWRRWPKTKMPGANQMTDVLETELPDDQHTWARCSRLCRKQA